MYGDPASYSPASTEEDRRLRTPTSEELAGFFHAFDVMEETLSGERDCKNALQKLRNKRALLTSQKERYDAQNAAKDALRFDRSDEPVSARRYDLKNARFPTEDFAFGAFFDCRMVDGKIHTTPISRVYNPGPGRAAGPFRAAFDRVRDRRKGGRKWLRYVVSHTAILLIGWALLALYAGFPRASAPVSADPQPTTIVPSPIWPGIED